MLGPTPGQASAGRGPVLVVDDDADQRAALAALLSRRGYEVVLAVDGQDAWEMLERGLRPSAIVLDLTMPRMDGWSFLERLHRSAQAAVPVIVTSAVAAGRLPRWADACLPKPFGAAELAALLARLAPRARADAARS